MSTRWIDHTAELELRVDAPTEHEVFVEAMRALAELLGEPDPGGDGEVVAIEVTAPDRGALLAAWLEELVFRSETERVVAEAVEELELGRETVRARVRMRPARPRHLVKAVTYHRLGFERSEDGYRATVVLDV